MERAPTKAHELLEGLGLTIVKHGAGGRYPCAEPGPAQSYRYWATYAEGRYKFGVQANPKRTLPAELAARLQREGFALTPKSTEAFMWLEATLGESLDRARATMSALTQAL
jgi:hypothetical protein